MIQYGMIVASVLALADAESAAIDAAIASPGASSNVVTLAVEDQVRELEGLRVLVCLTCGNS